MVRYEHSGNAVGTTLTASITSGTTTVNLAAADGWPTGSVGPFVVTIDAGTAAEEKMLVTSRSGTTLTVGTRGFDGTTATSHNPPAVVMHTYSATEADAANAHTEVIAGTAHGLTLADVVTTGGAQTVTSKTLSSTTNVLAHTVANDAARTALSPYLGMRVFQSDTKREWVWDGAAWVPQALAGSTDAAATWPDGWKVYYSDVLQTATNGRLSWAYKHNKVVDAYYQSVQGDGQVLSGYVHVTLPFPAYETVYPRGLPIGTYAHYTEQQPTWAPDSTGTVVLDTAYTPRRGLLLNSTGSGLSNLPGGYLKAVAVHFHYLAAT